MLKPIQALREQLLSKMAPDDVQRAQDKLLDALLHPTGEKVVAVFAHGAEAVRLAEVKENDDRFPHWAVQSWDVTQGDWVTRKSYDMKPGMRNVAYIDAKTWYPVPDRAAVEAKWAAINSDEDGALERLFDSRAALAEFWYETKVIDWEGEGRYEGDPWFFMSEVAETAFERGWRPNPMLGEKYGEKVMAQLANFAADWGELATPVLSGTLRRAGTNEVEAIVQYRSAVDAADGILQSGHDAHLRAGPLGTSGADRFTYLRDRDAGLSRAELVASLESFIEQNKELTMAVTEAQPEDSFLISIYYERWTHDDKDAGEPGERGAEVERERVDADDLERYGRDYGMSEPSASDPRMAPHIWFNSTYPREDREHFEQGIDKFYSLHVHEVNGHEPEAEDYQRVANLIGVKFDRPIELAEDKQRDPLYGYYINLDERGNFYADVRDKDGETVFEIRAGESLGENDSSIFEDGFMRNKHDLSGLTEYLRSLGVIPQDAEVLKASEFEQRLEAPEDDELSIG